MKRVLLLRQTSLGNQGNARFDAAFVAAVRAQESVPVDVVAETIETEPGAEQFFVEYLRNKYSERQIDVIIAIGTPAFDFARHHREMFATPPIVAAVSPAGDIERTANITGLHAGPVVSIPGMLDLALALRPDTCCLVVIDGIRGNTGAFETEVKRRWNENNRGLRLVYLRDLPLNDLLSRLATVPEQSMVFLARQTIRNQSEDVDQFEALAQIVSASRVPVFSTIEDFVGRGAIGGYVWSFESNGRRMAEMAMLIMTGTKPADIPVGRATYTNLVDWRQLQRWNIPESRVPAGSIVLFRPQSFYELYRSYIAGGLLLVGAQLALIIGLLVQLIRRRTAERVVAGKEADLQASYDQNRDLAGRLLTAQEVERTRIARDLHDGVCQELASASVDVSYLRQRAGHIQSPEMQETLVSLQGRIASMAETLRLLSHGLHPSVLHHIGLVAALQAQCVEVERQHRVQVGFFAEGDVEPASALVALSLFRIAQEALRNTAKHGHARRATVFVARGDSDLTLAVTDDGRGFDPVTARTDDGLGLVSIEERARLVQGKVTIRSQPGRGTTIEVRVPLAVVDRAEEPESKDRHRAPVEAVADLQTSDEDASSNRSAR